MELLVRVVQETLQTVQPLSIALGCSPVALQRQALQRQGPLEASELELGTDFQGIRSHQDPKEGKQPMLLPSYGADEPR